MARARKAPVQIEMFRKRGGKRPGAGRPPKGPRSSERHKTRPAHKARFPVHVTLRVVGGLGSLRRRHIWLAIREATIAVVERARFRIVHASVQANHIHLIVEAEHRMALARGMQAFQISAARQINRAITEVTGVKRKGQVFADRYHARPLTTPRQVRNTLAYVINNWRHHGEDTLAVSRDWKVDPFSTGVDFPGWAELADSPVLYKPPATYKALITWLPKTWLLKEGWKKHPAISVFDVPGGH